MQGGECFRLAAPFGEKMPTTTRSHEGRGVESDRELMLEDARSIREGLWRMAQLTQHAAESLDSRIEDEDLDGMAEAVEVREGLERLQALGLEVSEELDAYQNRHAP
jgi:hypothetical protein